MVGALKLRLEENANAPAIMSVPSRHASMEGSDLVAYDV